MLERLGALRAAQELTPASALARLNVWALGADAGALAAAGVAGVRMPEEVSFGICFYKTMTKLKNKLKQCVEGLSGVICDVACKYQVMRPSSMSVSWVPM